MALQVGQVIQERYEILRPIGQGGMGAVYEARDQRLGSRVALKQTFFVNDTAMLRAFENEARLLAGLRHPALAKVSDYFNDQQGYFLVMEYIPGKDIAEMLKERNRPFSLEDGLRIGDELFGVLNYLHTQTPPVVHRDIKPNNIKLTEQGDLVLLDFGLAKGRAHTQAIQTGNSVAAYTLQYAPLEQINSAGTTPRSDLYSAAATLYHILTNTPPIDAVTRATKALRNEPDPLVPPAQLNPQIPSALSNIIVHGMALQPEDRPASASEMQAMLTAARTQGRDPGYAPTEMAPLPPTAVAGTPMYAQLPRDDAPNTPYTGGATPPPQPAQPAKKKGGAARWLLIGGGLAALLVVCMCGGLFLLAGGSDDDETVATASTPTPGGRQSGSILQTPVPGVANDPEPTATTAPSNGNREAGIGAGANNTDNGGAAPPAGTIDTFDAIPQFPGSTLPDQNALQVPDEISLAVASTIPQDQYRIENISLYQVPDDTTIATVEQFYAETLEPSDWLPFTTNPEGPFEYTGEVAVIEEDFVAWERGSLVFGASLVRVVSTTDGSVPDGTHYIAAQNLTFIGDDAAAPPAAQPPEQPAAQFSGYPIPPYATFADPNNDIVASSIAESFVADDTFSSVEAQTYTVPFEVTIDEVIAHYDPILREGGWIGPQQNDPETFDEGLQQIVVIWVRMNEGATEAFGVSLVTATENAELSLNSNYLVLTRLVE